MTDLLDACGMSDRALMVVLFAEGGERFRSRVLGAYCMRALWFLTKPGGVK